MSGSFSAQNAETIAADEQAIAAGVTAAVAATNAAQASSGRFIVEHAGQVLGGHTDATGPAGGGI